MSLINYLGQNKVIKRICELLKVTDVKVNGTSVVDENGVANITGTGGASELNDLSDVTIASAAEGEALIYDATNSLWKNKNLNNYRKYEVASTTGSFGELKICTLTLDDNSTSAELELEIMLDRHLPIKIGVVFEKSGGQWVISYFHSLNNNASLWITAVKNTQVDNEFFIHCYRIVDFADVVVTDYSSYNISSIVWDMEYMSVSSYDYSCSELYFNRIEGGTVSGNVYVDRADGTTTTVGTSRLTLGNSTASGTARNSQGVLRIYDEQTGYADLKKIVDNTLENAGVTLNSDFSIDDANGTAGSNNYKVLSVGNNRARSVAGHSEGVLRLWGFAGKRHTIFPPTATSGIDNANYYLPKVGGTFLIDTNLYATPISRIKNTNYTMYEMALYVHNYILTDGQSICTYVEYSTSGADFFMVGYRLTNARGRYLIAKRTDDDWYSCRITAEKAMNYSKLTREAASSVTIP